MAAKGLYIDTKEEAPTLLTDLPIELLELISIPLMRMNYRSYLRFRQSSKRTMGLNDMPALDFKAYETATELFDSREMRKRQRLRLNVTDFNEKQFRFLCNFN
jgi:hypothetical protein